MITIRVATEADLLKIAFMSTESWADWWKDNSMAGVKYITQQIKNGLVIVAESDMDGMVGYCITSRLWNKIHIDDIYVIPSNRSNSVGRMLMEWIFKSVTPDIKEIASDCDESNELALKFHKALGFKVVGFVADYWDGEASLFLVKKL
jgi:ribosomal protein S18 acetylase RimI-like enzyme